ncbi:hypothetical protein VTO42DRAFT_143 [Malbranchea cinnamomea]
MGTEHITKPIFPDNFQRMRSSSLCPFVSRGPLRCGTDRQDHTGCSAGNPGIGSAITFSDDYRVLAAVKYFSSVILWDPVTGQLRRIIKKDPTGLSLGYTLIQDCQGLLLVGCEWRHSDKTSVVVLWDVATGTVLQRNGEEGGQAWKPSTAHNRDTDHVVVDTAQGSLCTPVRTAENSATKLELLYKLHFDGIWVSSFGSLQNPDLSV